MASTDGFAAPRAAEGGAPGRVAQQGGVARVFDRAQNVPARILLGPQDVVIVPDFVVGEVAVARGADSAQVVVVQGEPDTAWLDATLVRAPATAAVPPRPYRFPERCLVVVPTYDEADNLEPLVHAIERYLDTDILVVDDDSPDGTGAIADRLAAERPHLHVLHRKDARGLGGAYLAGFAWALERDYERVFEMDCDFSHAPWDLPRLAHASRFAEVVIGSRYVPGGDTEGWTVHRRGLSRFGNLYARAWLRLPVRDMTAGFRCYHASLLGRLDFGAVTANGYAFQVEMTWRAHRAGGRVREIPVRFVDREAGRSKMSGAIAFEAMRKVPMLRLRG